MIGYIDALFEYILFLKEIDTFYSARTHYINQK